MMICKKCGQTFEKPLQLGVDHEAGNEPVYVCPHCRNFNYSEAVFCTICEEAYPESDHDVNEGVCDECMEKYYSSYLAVAKLMNDDETRKEFREWMGIPTVMDSGLLTALGLLSYTTWDEKEREKFLHTVHDFFVDDKYWFATKVLVPAVQKYNIVEFDRLYDPVQFLRFIGELWDPYSENYLLFTSHYYNVPDASKEMAKALGLYLRECIEDEHKTGERKMHEKLKYSAHEFVADYPHVGLAYCLFWERSWLP